MADAVAREEAEDAKRFDENLETQLDHFEEAMADASLPGKDGPAVAAAMQEVAKRPIRHRGGANWHPIGSTTVPSALFWIPETAAAIAAAICLAALIVTQNPLYISAVCGWIVAAIGWDCARAATASAHGWKALWTKLAAMTGTRLNDRPL